MNNQFVNSGSKPALSATPEGIVESLLAHINSLDVETMLGFYEADAILINARGEPQKGPEALAKELAGYFSFGLPMQITARHIFVAGDIASLVLDWDIVGTGPQGEHVHIVGTSNDIARKGGDGLWRYIIDNPFGTQIRRLF